VEGDAGEVRDIKSGAIGRPLIGGSVVGQGKLPVAGEKCVYGRYNPSGHHCSCIPGRNITKKKLHPFGETGSDRPSLRSRPGDRVAARPEPRSKAADKPGSEPRAGSSEPRMARTHPLTAARRSGRLEHFPLRFTHGGSRRGGESCGIRPE
jgi:hypothetical protein